MTDTLVKVENVSKKFCRNLKRSLWYGMTDLGNELLGRSSGDSLRTDEFWAVRNVSFEIRRGECLGLIGRNGAGKTTILRMLNGLIKPDRGRIAMRGRVGALIALGAGFNPILSGRENIYVNGAVLGLSRRDIDNRIDEIIEFSEISEFIDAPVQSYSSGMQIRLGFSIASTLEPDVLLLDEVLAVGDTAFRGKCFQRIGEVLRRAAVVFVSHNEAQVNRICDSALFLESGSVDYHGPAAEALRRYRDRRPFSSRSERIVKDQRVSSIHVTELPGRLGWGERLNLRVQIELNDDIAIGLALVHFSLNNEFVANSEVRMLPAGLHLGAGTHVLGTSVGPLHLAHGRYQLSYSLFDDTGKKTIAQLFDIASFEMDGEPGSGLAYLVPMSLEIDAVSVSRRGSVST